MCLTQRSLKCFEKFTRRQENMLELDSFQFVQSFEECKLNAMSEILMTCPHSMGPPCFGLETFDR